jgi:hypothetical protein
MALCVIVHAVGLSSVLSGLDRKRRLVQQQPHWTWLFVRLAALIIFLHILEITAWAAFFVLEGAMPDLQSAVYFSSATYTTTGYGDLVVQGPWRMIAGIEALTGILMCGWSTAFFFAVVTRIHQAQAATTRT